MHVASSVNLGTGGTVTLTGTDTCGVIEFVTGTGVSGTPAVAAVFDDTALRTKTVAFEVTPLDATSIGSAAEVTVELGGTGNVLGNGFDVVLTSYADSTTYKFAYRML